MGLGFLLEKRVLVDFFVHVRPDGARDRGLSFVFVIEYLFKYSFLAAYIFTRMYRASKPYSVCLHWEWCILYLYLRYLLDFSWDPLELRGKSRYTNTATHSMQIIVDIHTAVPGMHDYKIDLACVPADPGGIAASVPVDHAAHAKILGESIITVPLASIPNLPRTTTWEI